MNLQQKIIKHRMALLRVEGMSIYMSSVDMLTRLAIRRYAEVFYGVGVSQIVRGMKK